MFRKIVLISSAFLFVACAHTQPEPIVEYRYIEKPVLAIESPAKPMLKKDAIFEKNGEKIEISQESFKSHMNDLIDVQTYIEKLEKVIESYRSYYENK